MNKIKLYLIIFALIFFASAIITVNLQSKKIKKQKAEIQRVQANNLQLMADKRSQTILYLKEKEVTGKLLIQRDSLAKALKIRPKEITKIVYITTTEKDTVIKEIPVYEVKKDTWFIADTGKCYTWKAKAFLSDDTLSVKRTEFTYHNKTAQVFYRHRSKKFLFFRFGKYINKVQTSSECGGFKVEEFNFIK